MVSSKSYLRQYKKKPKTKKVGSTNRSVYGRTVIVVDRDGDITRTQDLIICGHQGGGTISDYESTTNAYKYKIRVREQGGKKRRGKG